MQEIMVSERRNKTIDLRRMERIRLVLKREKMEYSRIVKKLIGDVRPVGRTEVDEIRLNNLKEMCHLVNVLITEIDEVAYRNKDRTEGSMKIAGEYASNFLTKDLGLI